MATKAGKPNILILWGDDIGWWNISYNNRGQMGYRTPNIDRIGNEGMTFTDYYGQQSCTAGRAAFITGQNPIRTGLTKVGMPGADVGIRAEDPTIAELLKPLGYATGQFGKNHLGDKDEFLPTVHGFDEFFGNLYHLNAEEEPEDPDYPKDPAFLKQFGPRGVLHCRGDGKGGQKIEDTGPLTKKRMETIDDEVTDRALAFIDECHKEGKPFFIWYNTTGMHFRTHCADKHKGKSGQGDYNDVMVAHDENIGRMLSKTSWASSMTRLSCTRQTTALTITVGRMPGSHRIAARRIPTGKAAGVCPSSFAGRARSKPASCSTTSLHTRTGCRHSLPPREKRTSRRSCSTGIR
jgi:arylsulfatase A-like enzyme